MTLFGGICCAVGVATLLVLPVCAWLSVALRRGEP